METCAQDIPRLKIVVLTLHIQGHEINLEEIKLKKTTQRCKLHQYYSIVAL